MHLLVIMALYDLAAVLLPGGPLKVDQGPCLIVQLHVLKWLHCSASAGGQGYGQLGSCAGHSSYADAFA
jgi:hypothetical protein